MIDAHGEWIAGEVLAAELVVTDDLAHDQELRTVDLDGTTAHVAITRIR